MSFVWGANGVIDGGLVARRVEIKVDAFNALTRRSVDRALENVNLRLFRVDAVLVGAMRRGPAITLSAPVLLLSVDGAHFAFSLSGRNLTWRQGFGLVPRIAARWSTTLLVPFLWLLRLGTVFGKMTWLSTVVAGSFSPGRRTSIGDGLD